MPLRSHTSAVVLAQSSEHLVGADNGCTATTGEAHWRFLVRLGGGEDLIHDGGADIAAEPNVDAEGG